MTFFARIRSWFGNSDSASPKKNARRRRLRVEPLERRQMLAVVPFDEFDISTGRFIASNHGLIIRSWVA